MSASLSLTLRDATEADVAAIQTIYAHHVLNGVATFEMTPPSVEEMLARFRGIRSQDMPYLVACRGEQLVGYCYVSTYRARPAYRYTVEDSIYLAPDQHGQGLGKLLLQALIARCETGPWRQMVAVISGEGSDASIALHQKLGFTTAGTLRSVGYKHERWIDTVMMQRELGAGATQAPPTDASA